MQLSFALASALLSALAAIATPVPATGTVPAAVEARGEWPNTAAGYRQGRRAGQLTNGELLARGLQPSKPRKLYNTQPKAVAKRAVGAPNAAFPSSRAVQYDRDRCTNTVQGNTQTVTFTDLDDLAMQCATLDQASAAGPTTFVIYDQPVNNCVITASGLTAGGCTATNGAVYRF